jgi:cyanophycin synthetase
MVAHLVNLSGKTVGLACSDGMFLGPRQVQKTDAATWAAGHRLMLNRAVETAVVENGARTILGEGLAYDRCSVGVVTNVVPSDEKLERWDVQPTGGEYYTTHRSIYRTQIDVVLPSGYAVLNAEDEMVASFAELCDGEVIFFASERTAPALAAHLAEGKRGVFVADGRITLASGKDEIKLCRLGDVPAIGKAKKPEDIANVLAAVAAGWALGLTQEVITTGVKTWGLEIPDPMALLPKGAKKPAAAAVNRK